MWDDCPWIVAENLYYTLTQAQSGYITDSEILSHATAYDREDGSPMNRDSTKMEHLFRFRTIRHRILRSFDAKAAVQENLTVVDSTGSTYYKQITVYVVDTTTTVAVKPEGTTRFINEYYYNQPETNGGLAADSIWLTDPEYAAALRDGFCKLPQRVSGGGL